jgi:hypothetical protein
MGVERKNGQEIPFPLLSLVTGTNGVTNGTNVFVDATFNAFGPSVVGQQIQIGSTTYTAASYVSSSTITLDTNVSAASGRTWHIGGYQGTPSPVVLGANYACIGGYFFVNLVSMTSGTLTVYIDIQDPGSGEWYNLIDSGALTAPSGLIPIVVDPEIYTGFSETGDAPSGVVLTAWKLPINVRVRPVHSINGATGVYSVGVQFLL